MQQANPAVQQTTTMTSGQTPAEQALLSEEEKMIRLPKQRISIMDETTKAMIKDMLKRGSWTMSTIMGLSLVQLQNKLIKLPTEGKSSSLFR